MYTVTDLLNEIYTETGLDSSSKTQILSRLNDYQRQLCGMDDWVWLEDSFNITSVANSGSYSLPIDFLKVKVIYPTISTKKYPPLSELISPQEFDTLTASGTNYKSDYPQVYHVREGNLYIWPYSANTSTTLTVWYLKRPLPMATEDYSTGSIAVTNGDETVTGTGTLFTTYIKAGNKVQINGKWYEIASVTDATHFELVKKYQGTTESGIDNYKIADVPIIPEDYQSWLWKKFCEEFYTKNKDNDKRAIYQQMRLETFDGLKRFSGSNSTSNVWANSGPRYRDPFRNPTITVNY